MPDISASNQIQSSSHSVSIQGVPTETAASMLTPTHSASFNIGAFNNVGSIQGILLPASGFDIPLLSNVAESGLELPPQLQLLIDNFLLEGIDRIDTALKVPLEFLDRVIDSLNLRFLDHTPTTTWIPFDNDPLRRASEGTKNFNGTQSGGPVLDLYDLEIPKLIGDLNVSSSAAIRSEYGSELSALSARNQPSFAGNPALLATPAHLPQERFSQRNQHSMPLEQAPQPYDEPRRRKFRRRAESPPKQSFKESLNKLLKQSASALSRLRTLVNASRNSLSSTPSL